MDSPEFDYKKRRIRPSKCKCCNSTLKKDYHLIYGERGKELDIETLLRDAIGIQTSEADGASQIICDSCLEQVIQTYEFKQRCLQAANDESPSDRSEDEEENNEEETINHLTADIELLHDSLIDEDDILQTALDADDVLDTSDPCEASYSAEDLDEDSVNIAESEENFAYVKEEYIVDDNDSRVAHEQSSFVDEPVIDDSTDLAGNNEDRRVYRGPIGTRNLREFMNTTSFASELSKMKEKIKFGIPKHVIKTKSSPSDERPIETQNLDVNKIRTSDDLINILEDDYRNEAGSKHTQLEGIDGEFKIPKMEYGGPEYLDQPGNVELTVDGYLNSVVSAVYSEYDPFETPIECKACRDKFTTHHGMILHISQSHKTETGSFQCIFNADCKPVDNTRNIAAHIFACHFDMLPTKIWITCLTCDTNFQSSVLFGKHMCCTLNAIDKIEKNLECSTCGKKLASRKRFLFHKQFHLLNARPKICIICGINFADEEDFYNHVMFSHESIFEYFCDRCDKSFSTSAQLDRHSRIHSAPQNFECNRCEKAFENRQKLDEHTTSKHMINTNDKTLKCDICGKVFVRAARLRKHMTTHETNETNLAITCEPCSMVFQDYAKAIEHCEQKHDARIEMMKEKALDEAYCCEFCEIAFIDIRALMEHRDVHSGKTPYECDLCSSKYDSFSKLKTHKQSHQNLNAIFPVVRKYVCDEGSCRKSYRHWSDLTSHRKTVHLINPSILKCGDCGKTFYQSWKLSYHCKSVHGGPMQCNICNITLPNPIRHQSHMRRHNSGTDDSINEKVARTPKKASSSTLSPPAAPMTKAQSKRKIAHNIDEYIRMENGQMFCTACGKQLPSRSNARTHIELVHMKVRKFSCKECDKQFYLRKDYEDHMRMHTAELPFKCVEPQCGKMFRTSSFLTEHRKIHNDNRPYQCTYCTAAFKRLYVLKNHIKQHLGIKGFNCQYEGCRSEFRTKWELNYHVKKRHLVEPLKCSFDGCDAEFSRNYELTMHYQNIHEYDPSAKESAKKSTKSKSSKKKKSKGNTQMIYVLPGPVTENLSQNETDVGSVDSGLNNEHNYQVKPAQIDIEASKTPKFVYFLQHENLENLADTSDVIEHFDDVDEIIHSEAAYRDAFDLIEVDEADDDDMEAEYLLEQ